MNQDIALKCSLKNSYIREFVLSISTSASTNISYYAEAPCCVEHQSNFATLLDSNLILSSCPDAHTDGAFHSNK